MAEESRLITVAIHTFDRAQALKSVLESEGVETVLQNVNLSQPVVSSGVRVRIRETDLPLALRIIENIDIFTNGSPADSEVKQPIILVPVDFSAYSALACDIAFHIATEHHASICILNTYIDPTLSTAIQLSDSLTFDNDIVAEAEEDKTIETEVELMMKKFTLSIKEKIKTGSIPAVKFTTEIREGVPEDVIDVVAKEIKPMLIVMGTRGAGKKERDLIGSVTAEVLDTTRFPVFTVPESTHLNEIEQLRRVVLFSSLDQEDILALDALYRLFPLKNLHVTLVSIPSKKNPQGNQETIKKLLDYCKVHYTGYTFDTASLTLDNVIEDFNNLGNGNPIDLITVPNRKKNVFARLFNPGLAHRLLFHADIPMMVIPV